MDNVKLNDGWKNELYDEFMNPYMIKLKNFLIEEKKKNNLSIKSKYI